MFNQLKRRALSYVFNRSYAWRINEFTEHQMLEVDYPVDPQPRYPLGGRAHPDLWTWFDRQRGPCQEAVRAIARHRATLEAIADDTADPYAPHWNQLWFTALDAMALYALVAVRRPPRIVEVGSGNSTKFAARAIHDASLPTTILSIDPQPRAEIDALCDRVIRQPLEHVDQRVFTDLRAGDFLFIDTSHRVFTNSDVTTFFLEVLPKLAPGVVLHLHDIFLPWDYPVQWNKRYYSEQYLLACWLLAGPERLRLVLSNAFVSCDPVLQALALDLFGGSRLEYMLKPNFSHGRLWGVSSSFWAEVA